MTYSALRFAILVAALVLSGCSAPVLREGIAASKNVVALKLLGTEQEGPPLEVTWRVLTPPAIILPDRDGTQAGASLRIGGSAAMQTAPHKVPVRYNVSWSGLRDANAETPTKITLRDAAGARAVVLQFQKGHLRVLTADKEFSEPKYSTTQAHRVSIILNMGPNPTIAVNINQGEETLYTTHPLNVLDPAFSSLDTIDIDVSSSGGDYYIAEFAAVPTG